MVGSIALSGHDNVKFWWMQGGQRMPRVQNGEKILPKGSTF